MTEKTVHVLEYGFTLCCFGEEKFPGEWEPGHYWTYRWDRELVTCEKCLEQLDRFDRKDRIETNP